MNLVVEEGELVVTLEDEEKRNVTVGIVDEIITYYNAQNLS